MFLLFRFEVTFLDYSKLFDESFELSLILKLGQHIHYHTHHKNLAPKRRAAKVVLRNLKEAHSEIEIQSTKPEKVISKAA